jgi:hypothetical protein
VADVPPKIEGFVNLGTAVSRRRAEHKKRNAGAPS